jgi:hypothetical protein
VADHDYDTSIARAEITLRPIDIDDWAAVHEWASTIEACRYQAWGPTRLPRRKLSSLRRPASRATSHRTDTSGSLRMAETLWGLVS